MASDAEDGIITVDAFYELNGTFDVTIKKGDLFDPISGIKDTDGEDGNLTSKIIVEAIVDTNKVGKYTSTYYVVDSFNKTTRASIPTSVQRIVTVEDNKDVLPNPDVNVVPPWMRRTLRL